ncbi:ethanolamine utilization protein EutJ [Granulicatella sp. zg-ZJ]|uniref:ethanolamine utilization protein EutJ n=1 Tax=unclassified Granulicatella TaxID=2630493 RepID=UPI0013C17B9B|nr:MULTISPECIES: ethanolamine utilization protein EutJ [unclassified Granulicatella]MBS4750585.1 ethanolamine utilization protein EutJ [Carnobacteriaceae bacterium zg-ZUI78]NEW62966.1 ethanolamine utilization protein EutJ [Granulicatella sp. zg-ZJ]NEW66816.1 ethanolamine utilization protein EutJ [Granulicatella sp. zg-84]QMI85341.1 ethanolamine utilization protein EutJ [Carnobacteriaceae bacterium zg-84]
MANNPKALVECNKEIKKFEQVMKEPIKKRSSVYYTGVDLGTACIVLAVLDENHEPIAGAYEYAKVVKDGMVTDYVGAVRIVKKLKAQLEDELGVELLYAAAAIPPGTHALDSGAIKNVVQAAGFELTNLLDEPTAANQVMHIKDGAIVDVGGGTTGISILQNGQVVSVADEPTGGTHFSLVLAGAYKMSFDEAELFKRKKKNHVEVLTVVKPVVEKVASIIQEYIQDYKVDEIYLVGGTCCLTGIEQIVEQRTGIKTYVPKNPMFVTPLGIAKSCTNKPLDI